MKKKILFILIIISLFVVKVNAAGTFDNPDMNLSEYDDDYISISDMNLYDGENVFDGYKLYYYVYEETITKPQYIYFNVETPAIQGSDEDVLVAAAVALPSTGLDDENIVVVAEEVTELSDEEDWISTSDSLKSGTYQFILLVLVPESSVANYVFYPLYGAHDDVYRVELEPNNDESRAFNIDINTMYYADTDFYNEVDVYSVNLTAGKRTRIYLDSINYYGGGDLDYSFELELCTDAINTCSSLDSDNFSFDNTRNQYYYEFIPQKSGNYYVRFENLTNEYLYYEIGIYQNGTITLVGLDDINYFDELYSDSSDLPVYRLYNKFNGEHLYTTDANEAMVLYRDHQWGFEGIGWFSATEGTPIYRLYNPGLGNHLYTSDENEIRELTTKHGWVKDNNGEPVMYSTGNENDIPIYRVYNGNMNGMHHLTTDENEYDALPQYGWTQEGVSMYADWSGYPQVTEFYNVNF